MQVVGCFIFYQGKFPILLRHDHKSNGGTWGLPAGKVEPGESDKEAIIREIEEETGFTPTLGQVQRIRKDTFGFSEKQYTFTTFFINLTNSIEIKLEEAAHAEYRWVTIRECYEIPNLVPNLHELIKKLNLL